MTPLQPHINQKSSKPYQGLNICRIISLCLFLLYCVFLFLTVLFYGISCLGVELLAESSIGTVVEIREVNPKIDGNVEEDYCYKVRYPIGRSNGSHSDQIEYIYGKVNKYNLEENVQIYYLDLDPNIPIICLGDCFSSTSLLQKCLFPFIKCILSLFLFFILNFLYKKKIKALAQSSQTYFTGNSNYPLHNQTISNGSVADHSLNN